jgi:hypothetical protein
LKKGLDKAFILCCNSKQLEVLEEGFLKNTKEDEGHINASLSESQRFTHNNNRKNKLKKKGGFLCY